MRCISPLPVLIVFAGGAGAQSALPPDVQLQPYQISVSLNLVALQATVRDRKGGFAADLGQQDFQVYEDGVRQDIRLFRHEDVPVTVGLVVDHSGSMGTEASTSHRRSSGICAIQQYGGPDVCGQFQ